MSFPTPHFKWFRHISLCVFVNECYWVWVCVCVCMLVCIYKFVEPTLCFVRLNDLPVFMSCLEFWLVCTTNPFFVCQAKNNKNIIMSPYMFLQNNLLTHTHTHLSSQNPWRHFYYTYYLYPFVTTVNFYAVFLNCIWQCCLLFYTLTLQWQAFH